MRDSRFEKFIALLHESMSSIKAYGVHLRGKRNLPVTARLRGIDERAQDCAAHAAPPPMHQHRHPANMADAPAALALGWQQATRADGLVAIAPGERMQTRRIVRVELDFLGHPLLLHEHGEADRRCLATRGIPRAQFDAKHC